ncbi:beta-lactamase/transpeptidase-like protein [Hyaloraphidium curvatum]|nr:beta-lactamase/transpeptidase-like protein [Hyaloraphidium curvatum]
MFGRLFAIGTFVLASLAALPVSGHFPSATRAHADPAEVIPWLDSFIAPYAANGKFSAFAFVHHYVDQTTRARVVSPRTVGTCYTVDGRENGQPDPERSLFRIGSVGKLFTATAVMQLYERGNLSLQDDVVSLVPELQGLKGSDSLKVLDCLRHTTGLDERQMGVYFRNRNPDETLAQAARRLWTAPLDPAGARITYSNLATTIAGAVVEKVSGQRIQDFYRDHISSKLELARGVYFTNDLAPAFADVCYPKNAQYMEPYAISATASGDHYATAADVARFLAAHASGDVRNHVPAVLVSVRVREEQKGPGLLVLLAEGVGELRIAGAVLGDGAGSGSGKG